MLGSDKADALQDGVHLAGVQEVRQTDLLDLVVERDRTVDILLTEEPDVDLVVEPFAVDITVNDVRGGPLGRGQEVELLLQDLLKRELFGVLDLGTGDCVAHLIIREGDKNPELSAGVDESREHLDVGLEHGCRRCLGLLCRY